MPPLEQQLFKVAFIWWQGKKLSMQCGPGGEALVAVAAVGLGPVQDGSSREQSVQPMTDWAVIGQCRHYY